MIYIIGISIAFFLSLLLLSKKGKTQSDRILAIWLLLIGVHLLFFYLHFSRVLYQYPFLLGLDIPLPLIHGPFLFLYTSSLTGKFTMKKKQLLLHFIPAIISWLYLTSFFYFLPSVQKIYIYQNGGAGFETFLLTNLSAIVVSGITYITWSIILLRRYSLSILDNFSYTEKINLKWLQYLVYGLSSIWILIFFPDEYLFIGVVLFVLFIGYFGIKQVGIFTYQNPNGELLKTVTITNETEVQQDSYELVENAIAQQLPASIVSDNIIQQLLVQATNLEEKVQKKKYIKSGLTEEMVMNLHQKITVLMHTEKAYTECELSLSDLANRLGTLPNYLSQVINDKEGKNFYDYINTLRIEEFKRLIAIPENQVYTMLSLSYDCGFNSKSSFNKNFKRATNQSPSQYLNSLIIETV